jgi:hypothetical protein
MQEYRVQVTQAYKVVIVLVFVPLLIVLPGIAIMGLYTNLPDWAVISIIVLLMGLTIGSTLYLVKQISPQVNYRITGSNHFVEVLTPNAFGVKSFGFETYDITAFNRKSYRGRPYFTLYVKGYPGSFSVNSASLSDADAEVFFTLQNHIQQLFGAQ